MTKKAVVTSMLLNITNGSAPGVARGIKKNKNTTVTPGILMGSLQKKISQFGLPVWPASQKS